MTYTFYLSLNSLFSFISWNSQLSRPGFRRPKIRVSKVIDYNTHNIIPVNFLSSFVALYLLSGFLFRFLTRKLCRFNILAWYTRVRACYYKFLSSRKIEFPRRAWIDFWVDSKIVGNKPNNGNEWLGVDFDGLIIFFWMKALNADVTTGFPLSVFFKCIVLINYFFFYCKKLLRFTIMGYLCFFFIYTACLAAMR